ncbi:MAG: carbonic anhydrase, partial [Pseudonocardia sp.]
LTFLGLPRLTRVLAEVPERALVTVRLSVEYLDGPASDAIHDWIRRHEATGGAVAIVRTLRPGHDVLHRPRCAAGRLRRTPPPVPVAPGPR